MNVKHVLKKNRNYFRIYLDESRENDEIKVLVMDVDWILPERL